MPPPPTEPDPFPIRRRGPVDIRVRPPGSKSQTNRALICAALAEGPTRIEAPLVGDDSLAMRRCLEALGVRIATEDRSWIVEGTGGAFEAGPPVVLDAGASGTTARFVTALATLAPRAVMIDGTPRMRERPIGPLVAALAAAGADIRDNRGYPPVTVDGGRLVGGGIEIDASGSSQFLSALLMAAPYATAPVTVAVGGLASPGYVTSTVEVMAHFGVEVDIGQNSYAIPATHYRAADLTIEADASAAVYVWGAAAAVGGAARVEGIPEASTQPDLGILNVLSQMGCRVDGHEVVGRGPLQPVDIDLSDMPDGAMTVAVLCALADGTSRLRGLGTLRVKETDRLAALVTELTRVGVTAGIEGDSLVIDGRGERTGAIIETYDDHRMAMAFALLGLATDGISIGDPGCVAKTWPGFFEELDRW